MSCGKHPSCLDPQTCMAQNDAVRTPGWPPWQGGCHVYAHDWHKSQWQHMHILYPNVRWWACTKAWCYPIITFTFDQPLWWKTLMIIKSEPVGNDLRGIILCLGGFHTEMSSLKCIRHLMASSGPQKCWSWFMLPMQWSIYWVARPLSKQYVLFAPRLDLERWMCVVVQLRINCQRCIRIGI